MTPQGFHHVAIRARNVEALAAFYADTLGLPELRRWPADDGGVRSIWLGCGAGFLAIERAGEGPLPREEEFRGLLPGLHLLALGIAREEREPWETRLRTRGIDLVGRTRWSLFFR